MRLLIHYYKANITKLNRESAQKYQYKKYILISHTRKYSHRSEFFINDFYYNM